MFNKITPPHKLERRPDEKPARSSSLKNRFSLFWKILKSSFFSIEHVAVCLLAAGIAVLLAVIAINWDLFNPVKIAFDDFNVTDIYYSIQKSENQEINGDIVLVDITKLRDRAKIAETIRDVVATNPKAVAVDIIFESQSEYVSADAELVSTIEELSHKDVPIVYASKVLDYDQATDSFKYMLKSFFSDDTDVKWGFSNLPAKNGRGLIRNISVSEQAAGVQEHSLAYQAASLYLGHEPETGGEKLKPIIYEDFSFFRVTYDSVKICKDFLKDKLVFIGTLKEEADMHMTPIGRQAGMTIQAYAANTLIEHRSIQAVPLWQQVLFTFMLCYLCAALGYAIPRAFKYAGASIVQLFYLLLAIVIVYFGFICFIKLNVSFPLAYPLVGIALIETARNIYKICVTLLSRRGGMLVRKSLYYEKKD